jgi:hypothetical protein
MELTLEKAVQLQREFWATIKAERRQPQPEESNLERALYLWIRREEERLAAAKSSGTPTIYRLHVNNINKYNQQLDPYLPVLELWLKKKRQYSC